jgi:hypothetical protein
VPFELRAAKRLALVLSDKILGEHTGEQFRADFPSGLRQVGMWSLERETGSTMAGLKAESRRLARPLCY